MLSRIRDWLSGSTRSYDAASVGRRQRGTGAMPMPLSAEMNARGTLASRSRYLAANNGLAAAIVDTWTNSIVGTGAKLQSSHKNPATRAKINLAWERWTDEADADGACDLYGLQQLVVRSLVQNGEAFGIFITTESGLKIRLIQPEQVDASVNRILSDGGRIVAGIEFDRDGSRRAYWILPEPPGLPLGIYRPAERVDAADVFHVFRKDTAGACRGVSWLAPIAMKLIKNDVWADAMLERLKVSAMLVGFVKGGAGDGEPFEGERDGATMDVDMVPGTMQALPDGVDVEFSDPPNVGMDTIEYSKMVIRECASGVGLPAWLVDNDWGSINYSSARVGILEFRRRVEAYQYNLLVFQFLRPAFQRWIVTEITSGRINANSSAATAAKWVMAKQAWADPRKEAEAERIAIDGGLLSHREAMAARGYDFEEEMRQIAADKAFIEGLGLSFSSPAASNDNEPPAASAA